MSQLPTTQSPSPQLCLLGPVPIHVSPAQPTSSGPHQTTSGAIATAATCTWPRRMTLTHIPAANYSLPALSYASWAQPQFMCPQPSPHPLALTNVSWFPTNMYQHVQCSLQPTHDMQVSLQLTSTVSMCQGLLLIHHDSFQHTTLPQCIPGCPMCPSPVADGENQIIALGGANYHRNVAMVDSDRREVPGTKGYKCVMHIHF